MFGRVRPSSSPPDSLERPPSKIIKDDSLSIYETTLMKLKLGSQLDLGPASSSTVEIETDFASTSVSECSLSSPQQDGYCMPVTVVNISDHVSPSEEVVMSDTDCSSVLPSSSDSQSSGSSKQQNNKNLSVLYLFSRYRSSHHGQSSFHEDVMVIDNGIASNLSSDSGELTNEQVEQDFNISLPICQI